MTNDKAIIDRIDDGVDARLGHTLSEHGAKHETMYKVGGAR